MNSLSYSGSWGKNVVERAVEGEKERVNQRKRERERETLERKHTIENGLALHFLCLINLLLTLMFFVSCSFLFLGDVKLTSIRRGWIGGRSAVCVLHHSLPGTKIELAYTHQLSNGT